MTTLLDAKSFSYYFDIYRETGNLFARNIIIGFAYNYTTMQFKKALSNGGWMSIDDLEDAVQTVVTLYIAFLHDRERLQNIRYPQEVTDIKLKQLIGTVYDNRKKQNNLNLISLDSDELPIILSCKGDVEKQIDIRCNLLPLLFRYKPIVNYFSKRYHKFIYELVRCFREVNINSDEYLRIPMDLRRSLFKKYHIGVQTGQFLYEFYREELLDYLTEGLNK